MRRADQRWRFHRTVIVRLIGCVMLITSWFAHGVFIPEATAVTVEEYCQLVIEILETSVDEWHERLSMVRQGAASHRAYLQELRAVGERYDARRQLLYAKYATNLGEYVTYMGGNGAAVRHYINSHAHIQRQIDTLKTELESLVNQYERAVGK